jgi:phage major head subunit gpT-like protein
MPTISTQSWGKTLDETVDQLFYQDLQQTPQKYREIFNVAMMSKAQIKHLTGVGFEDWRQSGEALAANFTTNIQGFTKTYVPTVWKSGFVVTRELMDDARFKEVADGVSEMARTAVRTLDKEAAKMLNNATNTTYFTGADGSALAATHTGEDGSSTWDNAVSGVLNESSLEAMMVYFMELIDGRGQLIDMEPDTLLVPPALEKEAMILMGSTGRVATADNDINVYNGRLKVMPWSRLAASQGGSDTAWMGLASSYNKSNKGKGLNIFMRVQPEIKSEIELETGVKKYVGYMRFAEGFTDGRGVYHSTGTA